MGIELDKAVKDSINVSTPVHLRGHEDSTVSQEAATRNIPKALSSLLRGRGHMRPSKPHKYVSSFERDMARWLEAAEIEFWYSPGSFDVRIDGKTYRYATDFVLNLAIDGKIVILETHGAAYFDAHSVKEYNAFMHDEGDNYYFIVITNIRRKKLRKLINSTIGNGKIANEIWFTKVPNSAETRIESDKEMVGLLRELKGDAD